MNIVVLVVMIRKHYFHIYCNFLIILSHTGSQVAVLKDNSFFYKPAIGITDKEFGVKNVVVTKSVMVF